MSETLPPPSDEIETTPTPEIQEDLTNDPVHYLHQFETSINFSAAVDERLAKFQQEHPEEVLTVEDVAELTNTMRSNSTYKDQLWKWRSEHSLTFESRFIPEAARDKIYKYWSNIEEVRRSQREGPISKEDIINLDIMRSASHTAAAQELVALGLAPNITVGRLLIQFMSIEKGYDHEDRQRDEKRLNFFRAN